MKRSHNSNYDKMIEEKIKISMLLFCSIIVATILFAILLEFQYVFVALVDLMYLIYAGLFTYFYMKIYANRIISYLEKFN